MYSAVVVGVLNTCKNIVIFWLFWLYIGQHINIHHTTSRVFLSQNQMWPTAWSVTSVQNGLMST